MLRQQFDNGYVQAITSNIQLSKKFEGSIFYHTLIQGNLEWVSVERFAREEHQKLRRQISLEISHEKMSNPCVYGKWTLNAADADDFKIQSLNSPRLYTSITEILSELL